MLVGMVIMNQKATQTTTKLQLAKIGEDRHDGFY